MAAIWKVCAEATCGEGFWTHPRRVDQRWCSNKCYQRTRRAEAPPESRKTPIGYLPYCALSVAEMEEVLVAYYTTDEPVKDIAQRYRVQPCTIQGIARVGRPRHLPPKACAAPLCGKKFTWERQKRFCSYRCQRRVAEDRRAIRAAALRLQREQLLSADDLVLAREMRRGGKSMVFIAEFLGVSRTALRNYLNPDPRRRPAGPLIPRSPALQAALELAIDRREHYVKTGEWK